MKIYFNSSMNKPATEKAMKNGNCTISALALLALAMSATQPHAQPVITKQPTNLAVSLGANSKFEVSATSTKPPTFPEMQSASSSEQFLPPENGGGSRGNEEKTK